MPARDEGAAITACIPSLRRYARGLVGEREAADDLVQDALERAWRSRAQRRNASDARTWLFSIVHNVFVDRWRRARRSPEEPLVDAMDAALQPPQAERLVLRDLERALARLPDEQREVLLLVGVEGLAYAEVAALVGVPVGTVMSRLSRAREKLRLDMEGRREEPRMQRVK